jgi:hypothetical protein
MNSYPGIQPSEKGDVPGYFFQYPGFSPSTNRLREPHTRHICSSPIATVLTSCLHPILTQTKKPVASTPRMAKTRIRFAHPQSESGRDPLQSP